MSHYTEQREKELDIKTHKRKEVKVSRRPYGKTAKSAFWV